MDFNISNKKEENKPKEEARTKHKTILELTDVAKEIMKDLSKRDLAHVEVMLILKIMEDFQMYKMLSKLR